MENHVFYAGRDDGLGERLRALLVAKSLAIVLNGQFRFHWSGGKAGSHYHSTSEAAKVFSNEFLSDYHVGTYEAAQLESIEYFPSTNKPAIFYCDRTIPQSIKNLYPVDWDDILMESFKTIDFSSDVKEAILAANTASLDDDMIGIHLRGGDLVYGEYRFISRQIEKSIPIGIVQDLINKHSKNKRSMVCFCQDRSVLNELKANFNVVSSTDFYDLSRFNSTQIAIFDCVLMSRMSKLFSANSGFSLLAEVISNKNMQLDNPLLRVNVGELIRSTVESLNAEILIGDSLYKAFHCKYVLIKAFRKNYDSYNQELLCIVNFAEQFDPENPIFCFFKIEILHRLKLKNEMELYITDLINTKVSLLKSFIKKNRGTPRFDDFNSLKLFQGLKYQANDNSEKCREFISKLDLYL